MSGKRANGEGNIRKRADGRWEGRYTVGHDPATGKQIIRNVLGKSQAEARVKLAAAIQQTAGLDILRAKQYTVETWIQYWLDHYGKINLRPSTHSSYSGMLRGHIQPDIGSIKLTKLRTTDLQRFYSKLLADGNIANTKKENRSKGLKPESVRRIHFFISTTLEKAVAEKLIYLNPAKACTLPKKEHTEMKTLPLDKINVFFKEAKNSSIYEMLLLEMVTGLRKGELIGLK